MGVTILIADDHEQNRRMIRLVLRKTGYATIEAADGEEALRLALEHRPAAILMDIQMPRMDGTEVLQRLKAAPETAAIPTIALTAFAMRGDRERFLAAGFDGYLAKPIDIRESLATLRVLLERRAAG